MCRSRNTKQVKQKRKKESECGKAIKTMCLGQCHTAEGARKERWQSDFAKLCFGSGFESGREVT